MHPEIICITPFETPDITLLRAIARTKALAVLDLGIDAVSAQRALDAAVAAKIASFGVRMCSATLALQLPSQVTSVVLDRPMPVPPELAVGRELITQVCSLDEARSALAFGAHALILKGSEAGGRTGDETSFVLLQHALKELSTPVWVQGGIGLHTAAAACAAGARGVVLDSQLALLKESALEPETRALVRTMDGSEAQRFGDRRELRHLQRPPLAVGQDGALAAELAERFGTVGRVVAAVARALRAYPEQARRLQPLAAGHGIAGTHGMQYPIAQGPMTRVSDKAEFAAAVAEAGALPFLALALMRGTETQTLLEQTTRALADRPWGVGILGFAPDEIRVEQLEVVRKLRPPVALIAGARMALVHELSALGITTYLHVPSPRLLDHFLKDGLRHFVLEGSECGGHIGPRTSFMLWEQAVTRLCREPRLTGYHVLFAGGIHDAVSAAMVAVLAAPLCARGARVGVLMGTAYLFTREAVESGAIVADYQRQALQAKRTVILESGPGHAIRALDTAFCERFGGERERLQAAGLAPQAVGAALDALNLGRLRMATKGLRREGDGLQTMNEAEQQHEGLYMSGQVAALREHVIGVAELHRDVCEGSIRLLGLQPTASSSPASSERDVAIIGMSCLYAGASSAEELWSNVLGGASYVTEVPETRWRHAAYFGEGTGDKSTSKWGGFLSQQAFDPRELGIPPRALASLDPAQILAILVARRAIADAGLALDAIDTSRISVVVGAESSADLTAQYVMRAFLPGLIGKLPEALDARLATFTEDSFPGVLANVIPGRLGNRLDLGGTNYTVNAACASSLAALDCACRELMLGDADVVVAGGVDLHNSIYDYLMFTSVHALSPVGRCKTFDASADGIALGEGVGFMVLKRYADAVADGDRIYARLRGVGASGDGRSQSLTAPRLDGQMRALHEAYRRAELSPADVELIEAHGTGTVVGDRVELEALTELMRESGAGFGGCALGSVKSQIGHSKCAAGMASVIKTAYALYSGILPPTRNLEKPNAFYDAATSPFVFHTEPRPWLSNVRRAGVSAFGFGGTNYHAVLESVGEPASARRWPSELFVFRASSPEAALQAARSLLPQLDPSAMHELAELAAGVALRSPRNQLAQLAIVADSREHLAQTLRSLTRVRENAAHAFWMQPDATPPGRVAFLFPGQGSQRAGMQRELALFVPEARAWFERLGVLNDALFPAFQQTNAPDLFDTRVAQPALGAASLAVAEVLTLAGVRADDCAGHSYGELSALCYAGVLPREQLLSLSRTRAEAMLAALGTQPGAMAVISAGLDAVSALLCNHRDVWLVNENSPKQSVIAGERLAVEAALARAQAQGHSGKLLRVPYAFHTPSLQAATHAFEQALQHVPVSAGDAVVWSNLDAAPYSNIASEVRSVLARQLAAPVRFATQLRNLHAQGTRIFVEVGPGEVLTGFVRDTLRELPHVVIATDRVGRGSLHCVLEALARLCVAGVELDERKLIGARAAAAPELESTLKSETAERWFVNGHHVWQGAEPALPDAVALALPPSAAASSPAHPREDAIRQYLELTRQMVETQREVLLAYLQPGATPHALAVPQHVDVQSAARPPRVEAPRVAVVPEPAPQLATPVLSPLRMLTELLSERTGYPADMLSPDADLEAELGVDSIKRMEVLQMLAERLPASMSAGAEQLVEALLKLRTIAAIVQHLEGCSAPQVAPSTPLTRLMPSKIMLGAAVAAAATPRRVAITSGAPEVALALGELLRARGMLVSSREEPATLDTDIDALVCLSALDGTDPEPAKRTFAFCREALARGVQSVLAVSALGGELGLSPQTGNAKTCGGISGLIKSLAKEHESVRFRLLDLDAAEGTQRLATHLLDELLANDDVLEVGRHNGHRVSMHAVAQARPQTEQLQLDRDSVVLLIGGARGITATIAKAMHERFGCKLELVGRSDPAFAAPYAELGDLRDPACARRAVLTCAQTQLSSREVERTRRQLQGAYETALGIEALQRAGARCRYHSLDIRDGHAVSELLATLYREHGRLDGVIHAAGVLEDGLALQKKQESFDRVYDTKVLGAQHLLEQLRPDVRFVVFFSSVAALYGNRGQTDYAAANDRLDVLARSRGIGAGPRVRSVAWGPWSGVGMVTPELERFYRERGVCLIDPIVGAREFLDELVCGDSSHIALLAATAQEQP